MRRISFLTVIIILSLLFLSSHGSAQESIWDRWSTFWWNMQLEAIDNATASVEPLGQHDFRFKYWNGGVVQSTTLPLQVYFTITNVSGEGWTAYVDPPWTYMDAAETKEGVVHVYANERPSYLATITLHAKMYIYFLTGGHFVKYANITFQVKADPFHAVITKIKNPVIDGRQDKIYTVPLTITNDGSYEDEFFISRVYAPSGWKYAVSESKVFIEPGNSRDVSLIFYIPHEQIYIQQRNYILGVKVQSVQSPGTYREEWIVVSLKGFHMTPAQWVTTIAGSPSVIFLIFLGLILYRSQNPCNFLPKPWKEEAEYLQKLEWKERKGRKKLMKEEYLSTRYYCKGEYRRRRKLERVLKEREEKQNALKRRIQKEWKKTWIEPYEEWKKQNNEIRREWGSNRKNILFKWKDANAKIKRAQREIELLRIPLQISLIPEPSFPKIEVLKEPVKSPKPDIPRYEVDKRRVRLLEPDEMMLAKIMLPLRRGQEVAKVERDKIRKIGEEKKERLKIAFTTIERELEREIGKIEKRLKIERSKVMRRKKIVEGKERRKEKILKEREKKRRELLELKGKLEKKKG